MAKRYVKEFANDVINSNGLGDKSKDAINRYQDMESRINDIVALHEQDRITGIEAMRSIVDAYNIFKYGKENI